ncbi:defensin-2 isoform X2 [Halyomorpha halys]|uniref:defensin-2 isoform X2 n=1 Tax=Halyomorpha halys TaxID=286706 RepID=UPI0006D51EB3|nr:defensin-2-like isoform X4 [Halyomorpha halys]
MNSLIVFAAVAVCVASALPVFEDHQDRELGYGAYEEALVADEPLREPRSLSEADFEYVPLEEEHGARLKRATCDALSFQSQWVTLNHSACAIHCLTKGYKGGRCVNTICNCRN